MNSESIFYENFDRIFSKILKNLAGLHCRWMLVLVAVDRVKQIEYFARLDARDPRLQVFSNVMLAFE